MEWLAFVLQIVVAGAWYLCGIRRGRILEAAKWRKLGEDTLHKWSVRMPVCEKCAAARKLAPGELWGCEECAFCGEWCTVFEVDYKNWKASQVPE